MSTLYDLLVVMDKNRIIRELRWKNEALKHQYAGEWLQSVGQSWSLYADPTEDSGFLHCPAGDFRYTLEHFTDHTLCFLSLRFDREVYLEQALNLMNEGLQIYDEQGNIIYFDQASKDIVDMDDVEQKNVLDLYDVDEQDSTVLTALHQRIPVRNRYAHYSTLTGRELTTVNNARPIFLDGKLIGVLNLEEDLSLIKRRAARAKETQTAMQEKLDRKERQNHTTNFTFADLIGNTPKMLSLKELAQRVALQDSNIMIVGETGTGKEILAQSIHTASSRRNKPFVPLNCAAVPETLIESILFGTAKGSFTGSVERDGLFKEANGGTLFLDELNSMSLPMQSKVLRVIQEGTFRPVGGTKDIHADVRIISTCNENVLKLVEEQKMRSDLFYRLATIILEIPPLRERPEDIEALVRERIRQNRDRYVFPFTSIDPMTLHELQQYSWPGNVRELFHAVDYAMNVADDTTFVPRYLPGFTFRKTSEPAKTNTTPSAVTPGDGTLQEQVAVFEAAVIEATLKENQGNISQTARVLGLPRQGLQYRLRKYGIFV